MCNLTPRPETPADEDFLRRLYASTRSEEMALVPWTDAQKTAFLNQQFDLQRHHYRTHYPSADFWVIQREGGQLAGRWYVQRDGECFRLIEASLLPEYRGLGIGTHLLQTLQAQAAAAGKPIQLHVIKNNRAHNLYIRLGFRMFEDCGIRLLLQWQSTAAQ